MKLDKQPSLESNSPLTEGDRKVARSFGSMLSETETRAMVAILNQYRKEQLSS